MSALFGLIRANGSPVADSLAAMSGAMRHWGGDGGGEWHHNGAGFGQRQLAVTAEGLLERQPLVGQDEVFIAAARLDNRAELRRYLAISGDITLPDSELMHQAWRRWGKTCLAHFVGDWAFAVWNRHSKRLFLARDHGGNTDLLYHHAPGLFTFSSGLLGLFALPEIPRQPDPMKVAQSLVVWHGYEPEATVFQGIRRLLPGHWLAFEAGRLNISRYWQPEQLPKLILPDDTAYEEAFLEVYNTAVAACLHSTRPIAATLSGGLDSGSVCALASRQLAERGQRLCAYTAVPQYLPSGASARRRGNEWELAQAIASHSGYIDLTAILAENISLMDSLERTLTITNTPQHTASNLHWILAILDAAQVQGAGVLLTGQNGNATVSRSGECSLQPCLVRGDWRGVCQALRDMSINPWQALKWQIIKPLALPLLHQWRSWQSRSNAHPLWAGYSAIHPEFAKQLKLQEKIRASGHDPTFTRDNPTLRTRFRTVGLGAGALWYTIGAAYQLEVRDPTLDRRVIEFCWKVPNRQYCRGGERRRLLRRALRPFMPDAVLDDRRKGLQAADIGHRVVAQQAEIVALLDQLQKHPVAGAWLDIPRMRAVLASLSHDVTVKNTTQAGTILLRGIDMGLFLQRFT